MHQRGEEGEKSGCSKGGCANFFNKLIPNVDKEEGVKISDFLWTSLMETPLQLKGWERRQLAPGTRQEIYEYFRSCISAKAPPTQAQCRQGSMSGEQMPVN